MICGRAPELASWLAGSSRRGRVGSVSEGEDMICSACWGWQPVEAEVLRMRGSQPFLSRLFCCIVRWVGRERREYGVGYHTRSFPTLAYINLPFGHSSPPPR